MPPGFLVRKALLEGRRTAWWGVAVGRRFLRAPTAPSAPFVEWSAALRARVRETAVADAAFADAVAQRCATVLHRQVVSCLGYGELPVPKGAAWHTDLVSGYRWPLRYFPWVNFLTHGADADVKVPWELSRLQWLVWLAEGALAHPEALKREAARRRAIAVIIDWDEANPLGFGPNWTVAMEVAIRAINLGLAAALLWDELETGVQRRLLRMLAEHRRYLTAFPEISDHVGNHYLLNVTGRMFLEAVVAGRLSPEFARHWASDLRGQFEPDGLHCEHAPTYHRLCVDAALWTVACAVRGGVPVEDATYATVQRAVSALAGLAAPADGVLPVLGDSDSGEVLAFGGADRDCRTLQRLLGAATGGVDYLRVTAGAAAVDRLGRWPTSASPDASPRTIGPFRCVRWGPVGVVVRAGPHGLHGRASHDHDDNASPWITWDGADLFVEAGCFAYTRSLEERERDLASRSHNLITIADALRFPPRPGSIGPVVSAAPIAVADMAPDGAAGFVLTTRWTDPVWGAIGHRRAFAPTPEGGLTVIDCVDVPDGAPCVLRWHVAPAWTIDGIEPPVRLVCGARVVRADLQAEAGVPIDVTTAPYRFSPKYGMRIDGRVLEVRWRGPAVVHVRLSPDGPVRQGAR